MSEPRIWTLMGLFGLRNYEGRTIPPETIIKAGPSLLPNEMVEAIEKSAYDAVVAENEQLKLTNTMTVDAMMKEAELLRTANAELLKEIESLRK